MPATHKPGAAARSFPLHWLILAITLGVSWLAWDHERQTSSKALRSQFDFAVHDTVSRVEQRMDAYVQMLRGVQGLLAITGTSDRSALRDYVHTLGLDANFSGIQAIGIVEWTPAQRKNAHVAAMRRRGFADYVIRPAGERDAYAPIIQREPYVGRNTAALGFDPWSDPVRRLAMEKARDSGMAAISGQIRLVVDEDRDASPGFIMYLPIFVRGQPHENVAERRAQLVGWIYAAFHMSDFMASLYGTQTPGLSLSIFDDVVPSDAALLYRTAANAAVHPGMAGFAMNANEYLVVAGHTWTLSMSALKEFETRFGHNAETAIIVAGTWLSLMLSLLVWLIGTGRARALRLAAAMTEELQHMAKHDALTELPNRALFSDRLNNELARAKRHGDHFAVIFLDLDNFKPINDSFGHAVGDLLLQQVARRLQDAIRASDTVGRMGGDEFVVLMPELLGTDAALGLAEKIRQAMRQTFLVHGHELFISCSLGVAVFPEDGTDEITLTKNADEAMYRAKNSGRDNVRLAASSNNG